MKARLRSTSLRVKLVAAVMALVAAALLLISVASTFALRAYLTDRIDSQLRDFAGTKEKVTAFNERGAVQADVLPPTDYFVYVSSVNGVGRDDGSYYDHDSLQLADLPRLARGLEEVEAHLGEPYTVPSVNGKVRWRMLVTRMDSGSVVHVAQNLTSVEAAVGWLVWIDLMVGGAVLIVLAAAGATIVRSSLRPLVQMEQTAAAIAAGDLTRRVPDPEPGVEQPQSELGRLSRALNTMLAQIEAAFTARATSETAARSAEAAARDAAVAAQVSEARALRSEERMRQFVADASHELRSPLTTIRGFAELYRQGAAGSPEQAATVVRRIEDEAARMGLLVEDLLLLARLDRERPLTLGPVELPVLAMDAVQAARVTAPQRRIELEIRDDAERLVALGDDARLRQVIGNLMTNALTHTPADAAVTLRLWADPGNQAVVEVADTGPGLTPQQRDRVFERFYRADAARTRHAATGTGLGLAIVAAIVAAHHGSVEIDSTPGQGATFRVRLPAVPPTVRVAP